MPITFGLGLANTIKISEEKHKWTFRSNTMIEKGESQDVEESDEVSK